MATQTRVPGAASSEVDFELVRFERTAEDRIEISGRWFGLRGRRFVRPVLNFNSGGTRRRAIALLEHKPWAADDGQVWLAAFRWPDGAGEIDAAELEVGPGLVVALPAPGGEASPAVRVRALRPHVPTPAPAWRVGESEEPEHEVAVRDERDSADRPSPRALDRAAAPDWIAAPPRDVLTAALAERDEAAAARDDAERQRVAALNERDDALSRRDAALRDVDRAIVERDEAVAERERLKVELERVTRERDIAHAERSRSLQDAEAVERERDQAAAERDAARAELSRALPAREEAIRERDSEAARADQAGSERDAAFAERKSAVAQRDRARRERDRAMRAVGVEPPEESPHERGERTAPAAAGDPGAPTAVAGHAAGEPSTASRDEHAAAPADEPAAPAEPRRPGPRAAPSAAAPPGTPLPSRPIKRIGTGSLGPAPEPKPLLTPVDAGRPRRLSRTRRAPSASARWAVRISVLLLIIAITVVLAMLLARAL